MTYASGRALRYVSSGFQGRKASIGFLGNPAAPAYREAILAGLEATVRPFGGEVRTPLTTSPASLRELAEPLLASGVQALVVQAPDPSDLASVLPRAASAGVPVVAVDSELVAGPVTTISSDSRLGVDLLTSCLQERVPKGRVLVWTTPASSEIATRRSRNASELLTRQARFEVVSAPCDLGQELENPQLKAILAPAELEEHEALAAVEAAGRTGEIQVLGFGGSVRSLRAVA
ncbi:MAG: sugar ABC transporter substrate-binding protein [Betaproteobacteria bacterium]